MHPGLRATLGERVPVDLYLFSRFDGGYTNSLTDTSRGTSLQYSSHEVTWIRGGVPLKRII